jgi:hypothetical protein
MMGVADDIERLLKIALKSATEVAQFQLLNGYF